MSKKRVLSELDKATIAERYANGETLTAVAADYRICHGRAREVVTEAGVACRPRQPIPDRTLPATAFLNIEDTRDFTARFFGDPAPGWKLAMARLKEMERS